MKKKPAHYVDNKLLYSEMTKFINDCREAKTDEDQRPKIPEYIGVCIYKIATRLATKPNFASYTYKDEMISDGIETCCRYLHNFDPDKSTNPFAYFTQIIYYAFLQRIQKEKKHAYIKQKSIENSSVMNLLVDQPFTEGHFNASYVTIDDGKIADFENKNNISPGKTKKTAKIKIVGIDKFIEENTDEE